MCFGLFNVWRWWWGVNQRCTCCCRFDWFFFLFHLDCGDVWSRRIPSWGRSIESSLNCAFGGETQQTRRCIAIKISQSNWKNIHLLIDRSPTEPINESAEHQRLIFITLIFQSIKRYTLEMPTMLGEVNGCTYCRPSPSTNLIFNWNAAKHLSTMTILYQAITFRNGLIFNETILPNEI